MFWKREGDDERLFQSMEVASGTGPLDGLSKQSVVPEVGSLAGPAIAGAWSSGGKIKELMAWQSADPDGYIYWSEHVAGDSGWVQKQARIQGPGGNGTHRSPAVGYDGQDIGRLAWTGYATGQRENLYWAEYNAPLDAWVSYQVQGQGSTDGPGLAYDLSNDLWVMVWKGAGTDQSIYFATCPDRGTQWTVHGPFGGGVNRGGAGTTHRPTVAFIGSGMVVAWKSWSDERIHWTTLDAKSGAVGPDMIITEIGGSSHGPSLACDIEQGISFLVWKGKGDDPRIFYTRKVGGNGWQPQDYVRDVATSASPALAALPRPWIG
jgi:hypothetical protein